MERRATVARTEGDFAFVKLAAEAQGCGRCSETGGCGSGVLNQVFGSACRLHKLPNPDRIAPGEEVLLVTPDGMVWRSALMLYGLPLLFALIGAIAGAPGGDGAALAGFVAGLIAGLLTARVVVNGPLWSHLSPRIQRLDAPRQHEIFWSKDTK